MVGDVQALSGGEVGETGLLEGETEETEADLDEEEAA